MIEHLLGKGREHRSEFNRAAIWRVYSTKKKVDPAREKEMVREYHAIQ